MAYDSKCLELAEHFAPDESAALREELAQQIQDAVEGWLADRVWKREDDERETQDQERRLLETREMDEHFLKHPHG